jgi:DNA-binding GntR family transcriptional regulator
MPPSKRSHALQTDQHRNALFLYRVVSQTLRERIADGLYHYGSRIPGVEELAKEFGVSTITVRRAIRDLTLEGLVVGRRGLGLFVATKRRVVRKLTPDRVEPIDNEIRKAGLEPTIQELNFGLIDRAKEASLQHLDRLGAVVFRVERVLLADGEPVGIDTLWLSRRLGERIRAELKGRFVMPMLEKFGQQVDHIDYRFEAATATGSQAALLKVTTGFPLLVIHFTPIDLGGLPILAGRTTTRADRFTYEFCGKPTAHCTTVTRRKTSR